MVLDKQSLEQRRKLYQKVAPKLRELYGHPEWRQHLPPVDELVCTILSQNTSDTNRDKGFEQLKARFESWEAVRDAPVEAIEDAIRPAGLAKQKAPRIKNALTRLTEERGDIDLEFLRDMSIDEAKDWLVSLKGIGPKTAAIILCFAFDLPAFPVDTHVHRLSKRIGFIDENVSADAAHPIMEAIVPSEDYYAFHLNLIQHGREICKARSPKCEICPLTEHCRYYQEVVTS